MLRVATLKAGVINMRSSISWSARLSTRTLVTTLTSIVVTFASVLAGMAGADPAQERAKQPDARADSARKGEAPETRPEKLGVLLNESRAVPGYNLINPGRKKTYLYDNEGRVVHSWTSEYSSGAAAYLLENGHLFRPAEAPNRKPGFQGPAASGRFQEFDWDGNLVWDFEYHSEKRMPHHDAIKLPNGNALLICWEMIDGKQAAAQGRRPETVNNSHLQPDCLVEIKPTGKTTGEIVWEWRSWDHLIQDRDKTKPNYGNVSEAPERFDLNYIRGEEDERQPVVAKKAGGSTEKDNAGTGPPNNDTQKRDVQEAPKNLQAAKGQPSEVQKKAQNRRPGNNPDWMHVNAVAYNADLDQIAMSSPSFNEIWIIDHSTTTEQAKGRSGGRWGKGGDILYRWGNPRAYKNGSKLDQRLFGQHNIQWIAKGLKGEGHLLVFNNGSGRSPEEYSSVDEFVPPTDHDGNYTRANGSPFGPDRAIWSYTAPKKKDFYSWFISGAQRLPGGNTLINSGATGIVFEVTPENETVWKFANPFKPAANGPAPGAIAPKLFEVFPRASRDALGMTEEQRRNLDAIDRELTAKLDKALSADQKKAVFAPNEPDDVRLRGVPKTGEYLSRFKRSNLKLSDVQAKELQALQREFDPKIARILTDAQKGTIGELKKSVAAAGRGGPPRQGNILFRATRYPLDHPAFGAKTLKPGKTLVEMAKEA
jgi:hypothetical protein